MRLWDRIRHPFGGANGRNGHGLKESFTQMQHVGNTIWDFWQWPLPGTKFDYQAQAIDGLRSSVVVAALNWLMRTFPEAPPVVQRRVSGQWRTLDTDPLEDLLRNPNPYYGGRVLWMATVMDFAFGEAFWLKIRNSIGEVIELWWVPRALIAPRWSIDGSDFIHHYDYSPGGKLIALPPDDVVHFRFGMDPANIRRGFSQLASVMREVYTDDQASNFTASVLRNLGIIGIVISPKEGNNASQEDVKEVKKYMAE